MHKAERDIESLAAHLRSMSHPAAAAAAALSVSSHVPSGLGAVNDLIHAARSSVERIAQHRDGEALHRITVKETSEQVLWLSRAPRAYWLLSFGSGLFAMHDRHLDSFHDDIYFSVRQWLLYVHVWMNANVCGLSESLHVLSDTLPSTTVSEEELLCRGSIVI